ncbi:hypothetical protein ES702_06169 [subsurface metagenome]
MAKIQKPPKKNRKGVPPVATEEKARNLAKPSVSERVQLKFGVTPEFRKEFKTYAVDQDMSMVELLMKCFELYKSR